MLAVAELTDNAEINSIRKGLVEFHINALGEASETETSISESLHAFAKKYNEWHWSKHNENNRLSTSDETLESVLSSPEWHYHTTITSCRWSNPSKVMQIHELTNLIRHSVCPRTNIENPGGLSFCDCGFDPAHTPRTDEMVSRLVNEISKANLNLTDDLADEVLADPETAAAEFTARELEPLAAVVEMLNGNRVTAGTDHGEVARKLCLLRSIGDKINRATSRNAVERPPCEPASARPTEFCGIVSEMGQQPRPPHSTEISPPSADIPV